MSKVVRDASNFQERQILDETNEQFDWACKNFNATTAPLAIIFDEYNNELFRTDDVDELKEWIKTEEDVQ